MSRCDLVMNVPMPDRKACAQILKDCLTGLAKTYPPISRLTTNPTFDRCAEECVGLDGRAIRKMVANALACDPETALDPGRVTIDDLHAAARAAKEARVQKGKV
jgi:pachytene checkpoint protein 2